jgi:phasin
LKDGVGKSNQNRPFKGLTVMTETTTATIKTKTTKHAASSLIPNFEMPKFDMSNMEMPEAFREMTEKGVAHAKDTYAKARVASEEAADLLQNTCVAVAKGATDYNLKLIEITRANTRAAFDYAHELLGVKSPSEFIELSTAQMRKQFDIASAQNRELCALAQKVATETAESIKSRVSKAFNTAP